MTTTDHASRHLRITQPSQWVQRFAHLIPDQGDVLDLACGGGRQAIYLTALGHRVMAVDRDTAAIRERAEGLAIDIHDIDLEDHDPPFAPPSPLAGRMFAAAVVVNYLHRPLFAPLIASLRPGGVLIYETFALGNETYGKPRNPDHLLKPGELLRACHDLEIVAYESGLVQSGDLPGVKQRICARKEAHDATPAPLQPAGRLGED